MLVALPRGGALAFGTFFMAVKVRFFGSLGAGLVVVPVVGLSDGSLEILVWALSKALLWVAPVAGLFEGPLAVLFAVTLCPVGKLQAEPPPAVPVAGPIWVAGEISSMTITLAARFLAPFVVPLSFSSLLVILSTAALLESLSLLPVAPCTSSRILLIEMAFACSLALSASSRSLNFFRRKSGRYRSAPFFSIRSAIEDHLSS